MRRWLRRFEEVRRAHRAGDSVRSACPHNCRTPRTRHVCCRARRGGVRALLLFSGLLIIAFHQYWSSVAAVMISLFGWFLALRGLVLMAAPQLIERGAAASMGAVALVRIFFGALVLVGLYLTYVGWIAEDRS